MSQASVEAAPPTAPARPWRRHLRTLGLSLLALLVVVVVVALVTAWRAFGQAAEGARAARMHASPQYGDGIFHNRQPLWNDAWGMVTSMSRRSPHGTPDAPLPVRDDTASLLSQPVGRGRVTWLGHSTTLIELGGKRVLTDPVFGLTTSPWATVGPGRFYPPPLPLQSLSDVDVVLISHDHYDHLDYPTIAQMTDWEATFVAPLGVGAHLAYWGIDPSRIREVDWGDSHDFGDLRIVTTESRHASGRHLLDQNHTLWAGYALIAPDARIFYSGDTGLFDGMGEIGATHGPFDLVMIEVGAYDRDWPDWHIGPEQAVEAQRMLRGEVLLPIHWGLFDLALHGWTEPMERVWAEATRRGMRFVTPRPGGVVPLDAPAAPERWWPELPHDDARSHPIIATRRGDPTERYPDPLTLP